MNNTQKNVQGNNSRSNRDGAQVWIKGALDVISREGVDGVKIERLAREIGVSKGSFYWFFSDTNDLLMRALEYWKTNLNNVVFDRIRMSEGTAKERINNLVDMVFQSKLGRYDGSIRAWAMQDTQVRSYVGKVDHERLVFLNEIFLESGLSNKSAKHQTHLFYRAMIAESLLFEYPDEAKKGEYLKELASHMLPADAKLGSLGIS